MAQLVLDDAFKLFLAVLCQIFFVQLDIVGVEQISASCRFQAAVEVGPVPEWLFKIRHGNLFGQLLYLMIVHSLSSPHF